MRLSKIRLNGFKSFVDATPVPLPGGITAIVGPNGCGKSNIIDAVRWVMGESSARHLRGGSMADVIFSGSRSRKPVGQASIELVFDNSDGALGGQYAGFAEIAIRRQVNRDGQSAYYLNGSRCRRRDITDVFLGTGLGPRSYSIIEQGTISRLIEAKPEELRGYLEEAAGISLYKERRRETERRMRDTRENLERLEDVRDEVGRQLEKLSQQAETAERYRALKAEERERRAELLLLRTRGLQQERAALQQELAERDNALESRIADQRGVEREMEALRASHAEQSDALNEIQGRFYQVGSDIARLEQRISHRRELRETSARELSRNNEALERVQAESAEDQKKLGLLQERLQTLNPEIESLDEALTRSTVSLEEAGKRLEAARAARDEQARRQADADRQAEVERARIEQLEARQLDRRRRTEQLATELGELDSDGDGDVADMAARIGVLEQERDQFDERIADLDEQIGFEAGQRDEHRDELDALREQRSELKARQTSLQTLQEAALGAESGAGEWLEAMGLGDGKRLGESLEVEAGWETAVEVVLQDALQAVAADDLARLGGQAEQLGGGAVMLYQPEAAVDGGPGSDAPAAGDDRLLSRVKGPAPLQDLLAGVHVADDEQQALSRLASLPAGASVVTRRGRWFGRHWLRIQAAASDDQEGVLARGRALEALGAEIDQLDQAIAQREANYQEAMERVALLEERRAERADERGGVDRELAAARARLEAAEQQQARRRERRKTLLAEQQTLQEALEAGDRDIRTNREQLESALAMGKQAQAAMAPLDADCHSAREAVEAARLAADQLREQRQDVALRLETARTAGQSLEEAIARLQRQETGLSARNAELEQTLNEVSGSDDTLEAERQALLKKRAAVEEELAAARRALGEADEALRTLDIRRGEAESAIVDLREAAESARYRDYELKARLQTQTEQLQSLQVDPATVAEKLPETATESEWEKELERLDNRIRRLGPINLAAIDEHRTLSERKSYLDAQQADLSEALETLQNAIQKIDRETRSRFRETFDKVNSGLQRLFPRLFGGGQAYLEMTDDDLLETGVTLMARPPGKRITNIHLLSGGEKALAAVALVFAIFELNPAPFCMLDEVDAPLDEANVGRFCDLLAEMSERVQFIVITHNKATMTAASHLAGVTMAEPGVSRLVAVDIESAAALTEADA